jgi:RES domain-containing protein
VSIAGEIPEGIEMLRVMIENLPAKWNRSREESLRKVGDAWVREGLTAALLVPSAAIKGEWNMLLNPAHADFSRVKFNAPEPFEFDLRMLR